MEPDVTEPDRAGAVKLPDGRRLGWARWGPADGTPVLFFSGAGMGRRLGFGADALPALGARLIAVDRPGLGASDPAPGRTLDDWVRDIGGLAAALDLPAFRIAAFSQGAPFALACAAAGVAEAVAVVSGQDDLRHPDLAGLLAPDVAGMLSAAEADPAGFEASFSGVGPDLLRRLVVDMSSEADAAVYTAPAFSEAYARCLADGFAQGAAGYARDLALGMAPWPFTPERITVPVDLWYGGRDASPVHSPDHGATLARRIPAARRRLLPEAGGALLWTHAGEILSALLGSGPDTR
ncbi:alpha/beta fold hydrolase [Actinorugispora endophytica]|uniref:Pimeloyl-ACP methyl ester carboxylesterase n=1 Tax=Actinorugispora endophytica TaxID=1605990 RepID=A0A4R6V2C8_9ACTN|nr:alpha/beta fold hydrolase [Actinorugispora endophytica]TDQ54324.1 pimeloyl-ACP methyl ester carboxylesterase [Actinorugispora endophytica]